jgi:ABC-2 type transport system permease protein
MLERIRHMLVKEFIQVIRDPRMRMVIFVIPCVQTLVIGYAVSTDVKHTPTAIYDLDNSQASRELAARLVATQYLDLAGYVQTDEQARRWIDHGKAAVVVRVDPGFEEDLRAGRTALVQVLVDGTDSNTATVASGYVSRIARRFSEQVLTRRIERLEGGVLMPGRVRLESRAWFNENLESRNFYVPGVIVIVVTLVTLLLTSMAVVREKEIGTMEQIMVTPIRPIEFILGKTVPFALIGFVDVVLVTAVGVFWFDVPIRGNFLLLLGASAIYLITTLSIGLLISTVSQTQQQAMMTTFFFFFPAMMLSGFAFPIANMPRVVQWFTYLDPLRYFLIIIRGVFLKGVGLSVLWPQVLALAVMGAAMLWLVPTRFRKTLA